MRDAVLQAQDLYRMCRSITDDSAAMGFQA